jgi:hypothetical protein
MHHRQNRLHSAYGKFVHRKTNNNKNPKVIRYNNYTFINNK